MTTEVDASGKRDIDGLLWGWKWDNTDFEFSFPTGTAEYALYSSIIGFQAFNPAQQVAIRAILANVASFTPLTVTETAQPHALLRYAEANNIDYTNDPTVAGYPGSHAIGTAEANPPELGYAGAPPHSAPF